MAEAEASAVVAAAEAAAMGSEVFVYCLYCRTQRCERIAQVLEKKGIARAFSPQILQRQRVKGENIRKYMDFLPGYVFVFSGERLTDYSVFFGIDGVIRKVGQADEWYELQGSDREFAMELLEKDGVVGSMRMVKTGEEVTLDDPLFAGNRGKVTRIDYRKERARVDFTFRGNECHTWVALEDVKKANVLKNEGDSHPKGGELPTGKSNS